jgi:hypothetical protein
MEAIMSANERTALPESVLAHYNAHYCNDSYTAFRNRLSDMLAARDFNGREGYEYTVMNLLIEASFERSSAALYDGAEENLYKMLRLLSERLIPLAQAHLAHFGSPPNVEGRDTGTDWLLWQLGRAQECAEDAVKEASDVRSWRGRVAYAWANAAAFLLHAASAILIESNDDSYALEKLHRAVQQIGYAVEDGNAHGLHIGSTFLKWITSRVSLRG